MGQILRPDNIPLVTRASSTTVTLASTYLGNTTAITIGSRQYTVSSTITLNAATVGLNGLDSGVLTQNTLYYIYFVVNSAGATGIVASTNAPSTGPTGYSGRYRVIGRMRTQLNAASITAVVPDPSLGLLPTQKTRDTYTPTLSWNTNVSGQSGFFQHVENNMMRLQVRVAVSGAPNNVALTFTLPTGYNLDVNSFFDVGALMPQVGVASCYDASPGVLYQGVVLWVNSDSTSVLRGTRYVTVGTGQDVTGISAVGPMTWASGDVFACVCDVFVAEWVGLFS